MDHPVAMYHMEIISRQYTYHMKIFQKNFTGERLGCGAALCGGARVQDLWRHRHMLGVLHGRPDGGAPQDAGGGVDAPLTFAHHGATGRE